MKTLNLRGLTPKLIRAIVAELEQRFYIAERPGPGSVAARARCAISKRELLLVLAELAGRPIRACANCGDLFAVLNDRHDVQFCKTSCRQKAAGRRRRAEKAA